MKIGRMRRLDYGLYYIGSCFFNFAIWGFFFRLIISINYLYYESDVCQLLIIFITAIILLIFYTVPRFYCIIARLHDLGKSGYYSLWTLLPFVSFILIFLKGEDRDNQYGEDPKSKGKKLLMNNLYDTNLDEKQ
ncbi:uncharacterized membrane protein YhaH (DUF805 family) [Volucribacter psittacicida]|uniref:Uncharacterized membrane protein YhaH (DUF805 family) n=1 Tax=Volucribacter psittacicida TaxID=203482 RepID=A0A4R1FXE2_9PAST|nr:DUF805 domain-containing protein [Volucribacter psittacicida]TCJ98442.1 uncharacterized membrane protein YhaH (DUF805 family) [Volucribacter psittacicida]